jgi:hypothetical protein
MATQRSIPLAFHTDNPAALKRELEEMASVLAPYFSALSGAQHTSVVQKRFSNRPINSTTAAFGEVCRISLVEGQVLKIALPPPDPRNAGLLIGIRRKTAEGQVFLSSPGCTVNGLDIAKLTSAPSFVLIEFDGEDYYTTPGGTAIGFSAGGL